MPNPPKIRLMMAAVATAGIVMLGIAPRVAVDPVTGAVTTVVTTQSAEAQTYRAQNRRVARRTARRTSRRHSYINSLPPGCAVRGAYHYCGGVYYQPVVQSGSTVYVVVTP